MSQTLRSLGRGWKTRSLGDLGLILLVFTKSTDLFTTIVGLVVVDGLTERNPIGAWVYETAGAVGLVGVSLGGVLLVVGVVEWTGRWLESLDDCAVTRFHLAFISYIPLSGIYLLATVNNTVLLGQQLL